MEDSTREYCRRYEPLSYYWSGVKTALDMPMEYSVLLRDGLWPMSRVGPSFEDQFMEASDI